MPRLVFAAAAYLVLPAASLFAQSPEVAGPVVEPVVRTRMFVERPGSTPWKRSLIPLFASQGLDAASSWGMRELNPILADSRGAFGPKAASIKFGAMGAFVAVQYLIIRKKPGAARVFSKINWSAAAVTTGIAARNWAIR